MHTLMEGNLFMPNGLDKSDLGKMDDGEKGTTAPVDSTKDADEEDLDKTQSYIPAMADAGQIHSGNTNENGISSSLNENYGGILNIKEEYQEMLEIGIESDSEQAIRESFGHQCNATLLVKCNACFKPTCEVFSQDHTSEDHTTNTKENVDETKEKLCEPCMYVNKQSTASKRCKNCDEVLCDSCILSHKAQKVTRSHVIVDIVAGLKTKSTKRCEPCTFKGSLEKEASYVCTDCEEYLCNDCKLVHKKLKLTRDHTVKEMNLSASRNCEPCLENGTEEAAEKFCMVCQECLCGECFTIHRSMKATRDHKVCDIQEAPLHEKKNGDMCEPCKLSSKAETATHFCSDCDELLCLGCMSHHQQLKATKLHVIITVDEYQREKCRKLECIVCKEWGTSKEAVAFCIDCNPPELMCSECMNHHKAMKATRKHTIETSLEKYINEEEEKKKAEVATIRDYRHVRVLQDRSAATNSGGYQHAGPSRLGPGATNSDGYQHAGPRRLGPGATNSDGYQHAGPSRLWPGATNSEVYQHAEPSRLGPGATNYNVYQHAGPSRLGPGASNSDGYQHTRLRRLGPGATNSDGYQHAGPSRLRPGATNLGCREVKADWQGYAPLQNSRGARGNNSSPGSKRKLQVDSITKKKTKLDKLEATQTSQVNLFQPGKPRVDDKPKADSIHLSWNPPQNLYDEYQYQIRYKTRSPSDKWKFYEEMYKNPSVILKKLQSNTTFVFQVRMVNHEGEGPYGDPSDEITTQQSAANHLIEFSHILTNLDGILEKRKIPLEEDKRARNSKVKTRRFNLGNPSKMPCKEKTILLVGATGSGKSTLVDGFINYILGVNWDDPIRFTLIDLEEEEKGIIQNQAVSQTHWITTYCINPINGSRIDYKLNIIDTPGFGDTQGFERDQQIIDQIRHLFSATDKTGVVFLDSVCFLAKAPDARLTPSQKYIFNAILSLFGQDIADNINILITFADGKTPPVLAALKEAQVPHGEYFPFNNSGLYADNAGPDMSSLSPMFWEMGYKSFAAFFEHLKGMQTKSLKQTKEVLTRRHQLEVTIENLSPLVSNGLNKLEELREEIRILEQHKTEIEANKNFVYTVTETKQVKKDLPTGLHVTNCLHCNITCHKQCAIPKDENKNQCWAMDCCGNCTQCSEKCHWSQHANTPYIFEYKQEEKTKTYAEKEEKYRCANGEKMTHEKVIIRMGDELEDMEVEILILMSTATECNNVLKQIALRPNPLSIKEHIDLLIEGEKLEKRPGFQKRISSLQEFRKKANIGEDVTRFRESLVDARSHSTFHAKTGEKSQRRKKKNLFGFLIEDFFGLRNPVESGSNDNA